MKKKLFHLVSRISFGLYGFAPVFGALRGSVGILQQGELVLAIRRNDGRGYCFPGGLAHPWESDEEVLKREFREETGLQITECNLLGRYFTRADIPCNVTVFRTLATGQTRESWEGTPIWVTLPDLRAHITESQRPILEKYLQAGPA